MICYRDMTFCAAPIHHPECTRAVTDEIVEGARRWWQGLGGDPDRVPIAVADFCTRRLTHSGPNPGDET